MNPKPEGFPRALLLFGPTAAGKSQVALHLAETMHGAVINVDSMQVYREWRILTARPDAAACRRAPHLLYGHVGLAERYSMGRWLRELEEALAEVEAGGRFPILAGGSGAYFRAATEGLADLPPVEPAVRMAVSRRMSENGMEAAARELARRDPATAAGIDLRNPRRVSRALETLDQTGRGLAAWQADTPPPPLPPTAAVRAVISPPADILAGRIAARFAAMMDAGALREAKAVQELTLDPAAPGLRALGADALFACLAGGLTPQQAADRATAATRQYAKRQRNWVRNRMRNWTRVTGENTDETVGQLLRLCRSGPGAT